jgi:RNA polymerase sigma-70 factor, ECF subfamily
VSCDSHDFTEVELGAAYGAEQRLVERILGGDERAARAFYDAHVTRVYRVCYRVAGGDAELAREFTQEAFIRAFDRLGAFRHGSALSTWLHAVAFSVAASGIRRLRRRREVESAAAVDTPPGTVPAPMERDLRTRLAAALDALPETHRVVFTLYHRDGYTHQEIGSLLNVPTGTSKARLSRARARLREELAEYAC